MRGFSNKTKWFNIIKDGTIIMFFLGLIAAEIYALITSAQWPFTVSDILDAVAPITLSFVGILEIFNLLGLTIFVPSFMLRKQKEDQTKELRECMNEYYRNEIKFIQDYSEEKIGYILTNLNISVNQLDEIRSNLIEMRCLPLRSIQDARDKIIKYINPTTVIPQDHVDSTKLTHGQVKYYIDFVDSMFLPGYCAEIGAVLTFFIMDLLKEKKIEKFDKIVIPWDSNFMLGIEVGKKLGCPVIKVRYKKGRIEEDKCYDGTLEPTDRVLIVHDVLVSGDQILHAMERIPNTCQVVGICCLIARKEWAESDARKKVDANVSSLISLDDEDIVSIIQGKYIHSEPKSKKYKSVKKAGKVEENTQEGAAQNNA